LVGDARGTFFFATTIPSERAIFCERRAMNVVVVVLDASFLLPVVVVA
jgi:hypothetical protein